MAENETAAIVVKLRYEKSTKGALRYQEVDEKGELVEQPLAKIGTLYLRKNAFARGAKFPENLNLTVQCSGEIDGPTIA